METESILAFVLLLRVACAHLLRMLSGMVLASLTMSGVGLAQAPLPDPLEAGWNGERVCEKLHEDDVHRILRCSFPPAVGA